MPLFEAGKPDLAQAEKATVEALLLAICLAGLAGWVDATGFIHFHGLFVSFMSGNSTQAAVNAAADDVAKVGEFARTILLVVVGVATGELVGAPSGRWRRCVVLLLETIVLAGAALAVQLRLGDVLLASCLALAMGLQNGVLHKAGGLTVGLTYVTGTLVQVGRRSAAVLRGEQPWHAPLPFLGLWLGLVLGGFSGALTSTRSLLVALFVAGAVSLVLLAWSFGATLVFRYEPERS